LLVQLEAELIVHGLEIDTASFRTQSVAVGDHQSALPFTLLLTASNSPLLAAVDEYHLAIGYFCCAIEFLNHIGLCTFCFAGVPGIERSVDVITANHANNKLFAIVIRRHCTYFTKFKHIMEYTSYIGRCSCASAG